MNPAELCLTKCLADGARNSREVIAEMVASGHSAKQVRRAREQLEVVVRRSGCRASMRTMWSMPSAMAPAGQTQQPIGAQVRADGVGVEGGLQRHDDEQIAALSEAQQVRLSGRIVSFVKRGLGADEARAVAVALVARDRGNVHALGSCIECQAFERQECPVTPRPATDVHQCWYRRAATP